MDRLPAAFARVFDIFQTIIDVKLGVPFAATAFFNHFVDFRLRFHAAVFV